MKKIAILMILLLVGICCTVLFVKKAIEPSKKVYHRIQMKK